MRDADDHQKLDGQIQRLIRARARRLVGKANLTWQDLEDIEQELTLGLLRCWREYTPRRGTPIQFSKAVLTRLAFNLLRHRRARKRHFLRENSSEGVSSDRHHAQEWSQEPQQAQQHSRLARDPRTPVEISDLKHDLKVAMSELSEEERQLLETFMEEETVVATADALGVSRSFVHERLKEIPEKYEAIGLRDLR